MDTLSRRANETERRLSAVEKLAYEKTVIIGGYAPEHAEKSRRQSIDWFVEQSVGYKNLQAVSRLHVPQATCAVARCRYHAMARRGELNFRYFAFVTDENRNASA